MRSASRPMQGNRSIRPSRMACTLSGQEGWRTSSKRTPQFPGHQGEHIGRGARVVAIRPRRLERGELRVIGKPDRSQAGQPGPLGFRQLQGRKRPALDHGQHQSGQTAPASPSCYHRRLPLNAT